MKLELKNLAPYLPYKLIIDSDKFKNNRVMGGMVNDSVEVCIDAVFRCQYKPLLRKPSDLTKEEIELIRAEYECDYDLWGIESYDGENFMDDFRNNLIYSTMEKLFEAHIDVFGLIEKGLAIDINTL